MNTTNFIITTGEDRFRPGIGTLEGDAPDEPDGHRDTEGFRYDNIWGGVECAMRGLITLPTQPGRGQGWFAEQRSNNLCADWCEWMEEWEDTLDEPEWTEEDIACFDALE